MPSKYSLFSVYGIESEYMIVDANTLKVCPIADKVLQNLNAGEICNEVELGPIAWSNELVNHVLELKCSSPVADLNNLDKIFFESIQQIQTILSQWNCILMPTAMNPWFMPLEETVLWPHGQRDIYSLYNEIFDCRGHGWSNLQSVHINLPYKDESEFVKLHSAIRVVLPLIPFFAASSPFYENKKGPLADNRLAFYEKNQAKIPSIIGNIIPENVQSLKEYHDLLNKIYSDISHYDHAKTLQNPWLNSRAAIPKFDVQAIEIRLMDIQESSYMDFALIHLFVSLIKYIINMPVDLSLSDLYLRQVYDQSKEYHPQVPLGPYFKLFQSSPETGSFEELRTKLIEKFLPQIPKSYHHALQVISKQGSLAQRLVKEPLSIDLYKKIIQSFQANIAYEN